MFDDPFSDPFSRSSTDLKSLFTRSRFGGSVRPSRKPAVSPEPEPEPEPLPAVADEADESDEADEDGARADAEQNPQVVLRDLKFVRRDLGFNEDAPVSVAADLPPGQESKTRVQFELFAAIPGEPERIAQGEAFLDKGVAETILPLFQPQARDDQGELLQTVDYFLTAKHSASALLKGDKNPLTVNRPADRVIESHVVEEVSFETGKSFLHPRNAAGLDTLAQKVKTWRQKHADGTLAVFGHADAVGEEAPNHGLSERRARSVHAFLTRDVKAWEDLYNQEGWGIKAVQALLHDAGQDPGAEDGKDGPKTQAAVQEFQKRHGLTVDGKAGPKTREALFKQYFQDYNDQDLPAAAFEDINGNPFAGCSEFNLREDIQGPSEANRRVTVLLVKTTKNFPIAFPCRLGDLEKCRLQVKKLPGRRRRISFRCCFYDGLVREEGGAPAVLPSEYAILQCGFFADTARWAPWKQVGDLKSLFWRVFGDEIPSTAIEAFHKDLFGGGIPAPAFKVAKSTEPDEKGFYRKGEIILSEAALEAARKDAKQAWMALLVLTEEFGHHVDFLLRNTYSTLGGDAAGDEGSVFCSSFLFENQALEASFDLLTLKAPDAANEKLSLVSSRETKEACAELLVFIEDKLSDKGTLVLEDGRAEIVEFFKIRGDGAIHEEITRSAAGHAGVPYDDQLDEGCAWPDVPCTNEDSIETCYYKTWREMDKPGTLAFRSHHGDLQFWHSMAPDNDKTNQEVADLCIGQAKTWYQRSFDKRNFFHVGKICHMLQDSHSRSHVIRAEKDNGFVTAGHEEFIIMQFQNYNDQDAKKHGEADKINWKLDTLGRRARDMSEEVIRLLKEDFEDLKKDPAHGASIKRLETFLRKDVYKIAPGFEQVKAGGTLPGFGKGSK